MSDIDAFEGNVGSPKRDTKTTGTTLIKRIRIPKTTWRKPRAILRAMHPERSQVDQVETGSDGSL